MARSRVTLIAALVLGGAACSAPAARPGATSLRDPLIGVWDVTLTMTEPKPGERPPPRPEQRALVALIPAADGASAAGAAYLGLYDADLGWLGIHPYVIGDPPRATGLVTSRTVRVVLNDTVDHGRVVLVGRRDRAGRITGSWQVTHVRQGARGRFSMRPRWPRADPEVQDALTGVWQLTLRVEQPGSDGTAAVRTGLRATLVLAARGPVQASEHELFHLKDATHLGLHSADLEPIGIRRKRMRLPSGRLLDWPPVAAARAIAGGEVEAALNPTGDHGAVLLRGRMQAGRIEGRWEETSLAEGARGTFAMERVSVIESQHRQD